MRLLYALYSRRVTAADEPAASYLACSPCYATTRLRRCLFGLGSAPTAVSSACRLLYDAGGQRSPLRIPAVSVQHERRDRSNASPISSSLLLVVVCPSNVVPAPRSVPLHLRILPHHFRFVACRSRSSTFAVFR